MSPQGSPTTNVILAALRGVLKQAWLLGQMSAEDYHRAIIIENVKEENKLSGRQIKYGEIQAIANVCFEDKSDAGACDPAIIGIMASCGLRHSGVVKLILEDLDIENGQVNVQAAKGIKSRTVWLRVGALLAVEDWLATRRSDLTTAALFVPINKGGHQEDRQMTAHAV
jgi:site-specific recombinase XerC